MWQRRDRNRREKKQRRIVEVREGRKWIKETVSKIEEEERAEDEDGNGCREV